MAGTALTYEGAGINTPHHDHNSDTVPLLSGEDTFETMAMEYEQLLKKLSQINERMTDTLQRHRDILADMSRDFHKTNTQHEAQREREELLKSTKTELYQPEGINRRDQYLKENAHIHNRKHKMLPEEGENQHEKKQKTEAVLCPSCPSFDFGMYIKKYGIPNLNLKHP